MNLWRDVRLAVRELRKAPGYTVSAILTLSLAIAANAAIFAAVHAVLLGPDAIDRPEELFIAWDRDPKRHQPTGEVTYHKFLEWAKSPFVEQSAAMGSSHWPMVLEAKPEPVPFAASAVSESFFRTLGTVPALGRTFTRDDDSEKSGRVAILSHRVWVTHFGADPRVVGASLNLGKPFTVVGVGPEAFDFPRGTAIWTPLV
ncbi:MAG: ABC transporter permease, partial [Vicinamibacterales bacterium]